MIAFLRALRVLVLLAGIAAWLSALSVLSLLPDSGAGILMQRFHVQAGLLALLGLAGTAFSSSGGGGQGGLRGAFMLYALLAAGLGWMEASPQAPAWAQMVLGAALPAFLVMDWFWSPPPQKTGFGLAALWLLYPAAYVGWALSLPPGPQRPYALFDPARAGGEPMVSQSAGLFLLAAAGLAFALTALVRLRQSDGPDTHVGYRPKALASRDQNDRGLR